MNVFEKLLLGEEMPNRTSHAALLEAFELGRAVSPDLSGTRPLRWAAIHFSELARQRRDGDLGRAWGEVIWPAIGAFGVFVRHGLPVGIVNDRQLATGELEGYELLFLSNPDDLTHKQRMAVKALLRRGGQVVFNDPGWGWSDPDRSQKASDELESLIASLRETSAPPFEVDTSSPGIHSVGFDSIEPDRLVVAITNDFSWVQTNSCGEGKARHFHPGDRRPGCHDIHDAPAPVVDAKLRLRTKVEPRRIFEAVSGVSLGRRKVPGGYELDVPSFETMALVVVEY